MQQSGMTAKKTGSGVLRFVRWGVLAVSVLSLSLMLKRPAALAAPLPARAVTEDQEQFRAKWLQLEEAGRRDEPAEARFSAEEINAVFQQGGSGMPSDASPAARDHRELSPAQVSFSGDHATGQFVASVHGKDVYVTVTGTLAAANGYLRFTPTEMKIGELPVPVAMINSQLQRRLMAPEMQEKLKLPDHVSAIRVEEGQLVVEEK
jgi:hypothetical protein